MTRPSFHTSRRGCLKLAITGSGCLALSVALPQKKTRGADSSQSRKGIESLSDAWIQLHPDNSTTVIVNHSEMGQGITTALPMIVAEELEADWSKVQFKMAPVGEVYKHPHYHLQWTVSSRSVESSWDILREAGATLRQLLVLAAAGQWGVSVESCQARDSFVVHRKSDKKIPYGELLRAAAKLEPPSNVDLKDPANYSIIGQEVARLDGAEKTDGSAIFGIDISLDEMLNATVVHPPVFGASVQSFNRSHVESLPGVRKVVQIKSGVGIVCDTTWQAFSAVEALKIHWKPHQRENTDSKTLLENRRSLGKKKGKVQFEQGDVNVIFSAAEKSIEATYDLPYQAHATQEPMNSTASVTPNRCDIWAPTQNQESAQEVAARITGLSLSKIHVHTTYLGGGFGRRALVDYVEEAVELSKLMKAPVKVTWSREEDIRRDYYRPSTHNVMKAVVDIEGKPQAWLHRIVGADAFGQALPQVFTGFIPDVVPGFAKNAIGALAEFILPRVVPGKKAIVGAGPMPYDFENVQVEFTNDDPGIPTCWWRSVAPSSNCFAVECFIDEIAFVTGQDPYLLRQKLLNKTPRLKQVLELAAEKAQWGTQPVEHIHQGIACHNFQETMMAMVADVSVSDNGLVQVHRVVCALDCGVAINPKIIRAQVQSGIVFGLTATLKSEITIKKGAAVQSNFHDFPLLRYNEMPLVETHIVPSSLPPTGIGETAVPVISPAVANAIFKATGKRIRKLPILREDLV